MTAPVRLPGAASLEAVLTGLDPASADADLVPASPAHSRVSSSASRASTTTIGSAGFFLMTRGHSVEAEVGQAIAAGRREQRARLPDRNARALPRWADKSYGF